MTEKELAGFKYISEACVALKETGDYNSGEINEILINVLLQHYVISITKEQDTEFKLEHKERMLEYLNQLLTKYIDYKPTIN